MGGTLKKLYDITLGAWGPAPYGTKGALHTVLTTPLDGKPLNEIPTIKGGMSIVPFSVRIETGITTTRKRITFQLDEKVQKVLILPFHDTPYSTIDLEDWVLFCVNAPSIAVADSLLNGGDINISSPNDQWPVYFAKAGEMYDLRLADEGIYITHLDFISADSTGTGVSHGVWVGGTS